MQTFIVTVPGPERDLEAPVDAAGCEASEAGQGVKFIIGD
jgi:hypothetical protein